MNLKLKCAIAIFVTATAAAPLYAQVDLLQRYPTTLTEGDLDAGHARSWDFAESDIFTLTQFRFSVGNLHIEMGAADVGIGHGKDGALWAAVIPRATSTLASSASKKPESISFLWLRFHPKEINNLFPPATLSGPGDSALISRMRFIASARMRSSCQAGGKPMVPEPKTILMDLDTTNRIRRFYIIDTIAQTGEYANIFEKQALIPPPKITPELAAEAFDKLWNAFDRDYAMFVIRPEVKWDKLREEYRPRALASQSTYEFAGVCAEMLKHLRDLHVWLTMSGQNVPVFNRPRALNANPRADKAILGGLHETGRVAWAVTPNQTGYLAITGLDDDQIPAQCGEAMEHMRNTRGLILDLRLNGGGSEPLAEPVAGRFLEKPFVYGSSQFRNGPAHTNLTGHDKRTVVPHGPWRYDRPVLVLIGQKVMSSAESFVGMMTGDPLAKTMGDHTCGSSGNPEMVQLPLDLIVSVPRWIDYRPDGMALDEVGFEPQIPFHPSPGAFEEDHDDLLTAALARLGENALPARPIEGPAFERALSDLPDRNPAVKEESKDPRRPRVISTEPAEGATGVNPATSLRIRFDRPMDPLSLKLNWDAGGYLGCDYPEYNAERCEFTVPIHLVSGKFHQVVVNAGWTLDADLAHERKQRPRDGFQSADHRLAAIFVWRFRTAAGGTSQSPADGSSSSISPPPSQVSQGDRTLREKLDEMTQRRSQLVSISERVQSLMQSAKDGAFNELDTKSAIFKWQKPGQFLGDVTEPMYSCADFRIGSDGSVCWWRAVGADGRWAKLETCPASEMQKADVSICDPFGLGSAWTPSSASPGKLAYGGAAPFGGVECFLIKASGAEWWINAQTYLPMQVRMFDKGFEQRFRFFYDKVNQPLPAAEFAVPSLPGESPAPAKALDKDYTRRLIILSDGSNGQMSARWGREGPVGRESSGLN